MQRIASCLFALVILAGCATTTPPFKAGDEVMSRTGEPFADGVLKIKLQNPPEGDVVRICGKDWKLADLQLVSAEPAAAVPATPAPAVSQPSTPQPVATNTLAAQPAAPAVAAAPAQPAATPKPAETPATPAPAQPAAQPAVQKPAETPAPTGGTKIKNAAMGATVTASSVNKKFPSELPPSALVDGDLATRWSSEYTEPQTVEVKLAKPMRIGKIRLYWENAAATKYSLSISSDGKTWNGMHAYLKTDAKAVARTDEINLNNASVGFIKLDLTGRVSPEWGFSLYEIEVIPAE